MVAGEALEADPEMYRHELPGGYLIGPGCPWGVQPVGWLGKPVREGGDEPYDQDDGVVPGDDFVGGRLITLNLYLRQGISPEDAFGHGVDLEEAWVINTDLELHAILPAPLGHRFLRGRYKRLELDDISKTPMGRLTGQGFFMATDPTRHLWVAP